MPLELWNTVATIGTFVVISATAITAFVWLRHLRSSNQISVLNELRRAQEEPEYQAALKFVHTGLNVRMKDPKFRRQITAFQKGQPVAEDSEEALSVLTTVADNYEIMGLFVKRGLVDRKSALDIWSLYVLMEWERLAPVTAVFRRSGSDAVYENFEYLAVAAKDWLKTYPNGTYPKRTRRIRLYDEWRE
jgi:Domain of unknown function (DUF4760)